MSETGDKQDINMDSDGLWLEELITDRRVGTIQRLSPITSAGEPDPSRKISFQGQTQILTPGGALPLSFEIAGDSLAEAVANFGKAAEGAVEDAMKQLEAMRREAASSIIVPGAGGGPGGAGPGGMPGPGGGLKIP